MPRRVNNRCVRRAALTVVAVILITGWSQLNDGPVADNDVDISMAIGQTRQPSTVETNDATGPTYDVQLKRIVERINAQQTVRNVDKYGPVTNDSLVIVIQVHDRIGYLRQTLGSLAKAGGVKTALLVFSHDRYDDRINDLVRRVDFCKTTQIFFPYSTQIYTSTYPGQSPDDCPRDIGLQRATKINCANAMFPDRYGKYREAAVVQLKHHWWWKVNTVFDRLEAVKNYSGPVLFIEEDHFMVEDFIYVLKRMRRVCRECKIFSLGTHSDDGRVLNAQIPQIHVSNWVSNLGMSFNRSVWKELVQCAGEFCNYDDYNWDWSLQKMTNECPGHRFWTATLQHSRVHHIGKW